MSLVNKRELSEIFGVSERTLTDWQKEGLPVLVDGERGQENTYDTVQVHAWILKREFEKASFETSKDRLARLQADRVQIDIDEKLGRLVPVDEIEPAWSGFVASARAYLREQPERLAQLLELTEGVEAKRDLLAETNDEFLRKLAGYKPDAQDADQSDAASRQAAGASAAHDGGAMGREVSRAGQ